MMDDLMISCLEWVPVPDDLEGDGPTPYWAQRRDGYWHVRVGRTGRVVNDRGVRYRKALDLARDVKLLAADEGVDHEAEARWQGGG